MQGMQVEGLTADNNFDDDVLYCALHLLRKKRLNRQLAVSFLNSTLRLLQAYIKYRGGLKQVKRCQRSLSENQDVADCFWLHARKRRLTRQLEMSAAHCCQEISEAINQYKGALDAAESNLIYLAPTRIKAFLQSVTGLQVCI